MVQICFPMVCSGTPLMIGPESTTKFRTNGSPSADVSTAAEGVSVVGGGVLPMASNAAFFFVSGPTTTNTEEFVDVNRN